MQQELEARRQELSTKERSLAQAEAAAEKRWAKLTEDVSAKVRLALHVHTAAGACLPGLCTAVSSDVLAQKQDYNVCRHLSRMPRCTSDDGNAL